jgi:tRNA pseudouridine55 synthase
MTARRNSPRRQVDGMLLLDKPEGMSSNAALQTAKRLFNAAKAGHTGTLDPQATGLLPICFGEATKFSQLLLDAEKAYDATIQLGIVTTTGDGEGEILQRRDVSVTPDDINRILPQFTGSIRQLPPMYSALKHRGKPLYAYARAGQEVQREPRETTIDELKLVDFAGEQLRIRIRCSKGTYVRVLAEDIGRALGCGGSLAALRRTASGPFSIDEAVTLEHLAAVNEVARDQYLMGLDKLLAGLPAMALEKTDAAQFATGRRIAISPIGNAGMMRIYGPGNDFIGVGEVAADGLLVPKRLIAHRAKNA